MDLGNMLKKKKGQQKRTHTVWLHSYKVQKVVKLIYDVKTQARSFIWGTSKDWGASNVVSWLGGVYMVCLIWFVKVHQAVHSW